MVGVDIKPQPHYGGEEFHQADALEFCRRHGREFDVIHASPPCQNYSVLRGFSNNNHPRLIEQVRVMFTEIGRPWIIENVPGAPLRNPLMLCGTMFDGLGVRRHRLFESNITLTAPRKCDHSVKWNPLRYKVLRHGIWYMSRFCPVYGGGGGKGASGIKDWGPAMGIDWMVNRAEMSQAIPPAYTECLGLQIRKFLI